MIIGKNSAIKGFTLLVWAAALLVSLIGCIITKNLFFIISGAVATAAGALAVWLKFKELSGGEKTASTENRKGNLWYGLALMLFGLFTMLSLVGCIVTGIWLFIVAGLIAAAMNGYSLYNTDKEWSYGKKN